MTLRRRHGLLALLIVLVAVVAASAVALVSSRPGDEGEQTTPPPSTTTATPSTTAPTLDTAPEARPPSSPPTTAPRTTSGPPSGRVVWQEDFEEPGWEERLGVAGAFREENLLVRDGPSDEGGEALRVKAPANPGGFTGYGADLRLSFEKMGIELLEDGYLRYGVFLPPGWHPYAGGKLPGLAGISEGDEPFSTSGGGEYHESSWWGGVNFVPPVDGDLDQSRLSSFIWAKAAAGTDNDSVRNPDNNIRGGINIRLHKDPDWRDPWGEDQPFLTLRRGAWNEIVVRYRMNTPGEEDGIYQVWLNGELGVDLRDVMYRTTDYPELRMNQVMFVNFYGGPSANKTDQHWFVDDIQIGAL